MPDRAPATTMASPGDTPAERADPSRGNIGDGARRSEAQDLGVAWFQQFKEMAHFLVQKNRVTLVNITCFGHIRDYLIQYDVLTGNDVEEVEARGTRHEQMSKFLDILSMKSCSAVQTFFIVILRQDDQIYDQIDWLDPRRNLCQLQELKEKDLLAQVREEVVPWYIGNLFQLQPIRSSKGFTLNFDAVYINARMTSCLMKDTCPKEFRQIQADPVKTLLQTTHQLQSRLVIFVQGPAGIGKTTFCRKLAYSWAKTVQRNQGSSLDAIFMLDAPQIGGDLTESIAQQLLPDKCCLDVDAISSRKEYQQRCLLVIDGVERLSDAGKAAVKKLVEGKHFRHSHVLLTGRPEATDEFVRFVHIELHLGGFTPENVSAYVRHFFHGDTRCSADRLLNRIANNPELRKMAATPFVLMLLCLLEDENRGEIPSKFINTVEEVVDAVLSEYVSDDRHQKEKPNKFDLVVEAGSLSYLGFKSGTFSYQESTVTDPCRGGLGEHLLRSGLLSRGYGMSRRHSIRHWEFTHKSMQEFLCAWYLAGHSEPFLKSKLAALKHNHSGTLNMYIHLMRMLKDRPELYHVQKSLFEGLDLQVPGLGTVRALLAAHD